MPGHVSPDFGEIGFAGAGGVWREKKQPGGGKSGEGSGRAAPKLGERHVAVSPEYDGPVIVFTNVAGMVNT